jgi:hypothetical protein
MRSVHFVLDVLWSCLAEGMRNAVDLLHRQPDNSFSLSPQKLYINLKFIFYMEARKAILSA